MSDREPALVVTRSEPAAEPMPVFYYDLGSPDCYLVAEQIMTVLPVVPEWEPVLGAELLPDHARAFGPADRARVEAGVSELGLQPLRWPTKLPADSRQAMLAATYAKRVGRAIAFSMAAFRQAYAGGRDLGDENTVLIAGAACEMHPTALLKGISLRSVQEALAAAHDRARQDGVTALPAIVADGEAFCGRQALEQAVRALGRRAE